MKVFIVISYKAGQDHDQIEGVFSSSDKAEAYIAACRDDHFYEGCGFMTACERVDEYA